MITNISFISRLQAESHLFNKNDVIISINEPNGEMANIKGTVNILPLFFLDIDDTLLGTPFGNGIFTKEQAKKIIDFVELFHNNSDEHKLIVHCNAGISRSAAVALFAHYHTKAPFPNLNKASFANKYIVRVLSELTNTNILIPEEKKSPGGIILF